MLKKLLMCAMALMLLFSCALAENLPADVQGMLPAGAAIEKTESMGNINMLTLSIPDTGEVILAAWDDEGMLFMETQTPAVCSADAAPVERGRAEELIRAAYPDCRILFSEDVPEGKRLAVAGDSFCGSIVVADDKIHSRTLKMGEIYQNGSLTMDGALQLLALHRPEAQLRAVELDEDDGAYVYEGEALLNGEVYEFELDVSSGKLLEWERD